MLLLNFSTQSFLKSSLRLSFCILFFLTILTALQAQISGTVATTRGEMLEGANVYIQALKIGKSTDKNGHFEFDQTLPDGQYTLSVSYIGFRTQIINTEAKQGQKMKIILQEDPVLSGQITVSATRADQRTPMTFTTIDKAALSKNNLGQDVPFLLRWTPSTVVTSDAGTGIGYTGIWIRGSDPTRVNVTINGIPLNDAESQGVFWVDLPDFASSTEDIQIQRGVGASTNGTGAFGATVNLNTNKVYNDSYASIDASIGSFNTLKSKLAFGTGILENGFTFDGRLSRITSDGYIDRATSDLNSWYLSGGWIKNNTSLRLIVFSGNEITYQAWNGVDAGDVDDPKLRTSNSAGTEKEGDPYENEVDDYGQTHLQLLFNHQFNKQWYLNLAGHYTKGKGFFEQYKAGQNLSDYGIVPSIDSINISDLIRRRWLDNDFYGSTFSLHYNNDASGLKATLGGSFHYYDGRHFGEVIWARFAGNSETEHLYYDNNGIKKDANIFTKINYNLNAKWDAYLDLQFRSIDYDFLGINNEGDAINQAAKLRFFNPKVGIQYRPSASSRFYTSFAVANREPNRNDYVGNTTDHRPKPEQLYDLELGWSKNTNKAAFEANVYYMYYIDQLVLNGQINDVGDLLRINVDKSYRMGIELTAGTDLTSSLSLQGNVTFSQNKIVSFTEFLDDYDADFNWIGQREVKRAGTDLAFSPNLISAMELRYDFLPKKEAHDLSIALRGKYIGRRFLDNSSDEGNSLDPYFFSDWQLQYTLHGGWFKKVRVNFQVLNWLGHLYESNGWSYRYVLDGQDQLLRGLYPQAGQQLMLGLGIDF